MSGAAVNDLPNQLREIAAMDRNACAQALSALPGVTVPPLLRADTLRRLLTYEVQKRALGGLTPRERRTLRTISSGQSGGGDRRAPMTPGTHLVREWNGRTYRVDVTEAGFLLDGKIYPSLTALAKRITGTAWSGPRFFGLTPKRTS